LAALALRDPAAIEGNKEFLVAYARRQTPDLAECRGMRDLTVVQRAAVLALKPLGALPASEVEALERALAVNNVVLDSHYYAHRYPVEKRRPFAEREFEKDLCEWLFDADPEARAHAALWLWLRGATPKSEPALRKALGDESKLVRAFAALTLGDPASLGANQEFLRQYVRKTVPWGDECEYCRTLRSVRLAAARALASTGAIPPNEAAEFEATFGDLSRRVPDAPGE
jgi:hypothetical protein